MPRRYNVALGYRLNHNAMRKMLIRETTFIEGNTRQYLRVDFGFDGNHFSVTTLSGESCPAKLRDDEIYDSRTKKPYQATGGGCQHELVVKHFPDMKDIVDLHLCDINGIPMFGRSNGYFIFKRDGLDAAAEYMHLSKDERIRLADEMHKAAVIRAEGDSVETLRAGEDFIFNRFFDSMLDTWKAQADAVIEKYGLKD